MKWIIILGVAIYFVRKLLYSADRSTSKPTPKPTPWNSGFDASFEGKDVVTPGSEVVIGNSHRTPLTLHACPRSIAFSPAVRCIQANAFQNASRLESVALAKEIGSVGDGAFAFCTALKSVSIEKGFSPTPMFENAFLGCASIETVTAEPRWAKLFPSAKKWIIPDGVTNIEAQSFKGCSELTSITVPDSVTSVGRSAFSECSGLMNPLYNVSETRLWKVPSSFTGCFSIPDGVTRIGDFAFDSCSGLTSIKIPNSVTSIGRGAFRDCSGLTSITIPDNVTSIEGDSSCACVFAGCTGLTSIRIPGSLKVSKYNHFVTTTKTLQIGPGSMKWDTGQSPFAAKNSFEVDERNETLCARDGILFSKDGTILVSVPRGIAGDFVVPDGVTAIAPGAFRCCRLLRSVRISPTVKTIGWAAFLDCHSLVDCEIPSSVESIEVAAFRNCRSLEHIHLPQNVSVDDAFLYCFQLRTVEFDATVRFLGTPFRGCERLSQETRDRFRAYTGSFPLIAEANDNG